MRENNRKCVICGVRYTYCPGCGEDKDKPAWMSIFHDENCKNIYHITSNYIGNAITKEEAIEQLKECKINTTDDYNPVFKERIESILDGDVIDKSVVKEEKNVEVEEKVEDKVQEYNEMTSTNRRIKKRREQEDIAVG